MKRHYSFCDSMALQFIQKVYSFRFGRVIKRTECAGRERLTLFYTFWFKSRAMTSSSIPFSSFAVLLVGLILLFVAGPASSRIQIPAALVFGDSIVDTGNNNEILTSPARCNFPPYGRDFYGGVPTGRFSNGKVPSDFLGWKSLGLRTLYRRTRTRS
ncbi:unnamed protein product [Linum tenue]|uniref:GDSL esterase/lipase n=1 Tax=Linum tenue TaxID=586396 RepID=A0AAV0HCK9_9ROSI|nr:unnamed protein product [Linum tenue]